MKKFITNKFILSNKTAESLYEKYGKDLPIIDYHCHINPKDIFEDKKYDNITQMWLYGDHYKWRIMRACGVEEKYITGDASDHDKFIKYAESLEKAIGNPLHHWSHLELKKYFDFDGILKSSTAENVWDLTCKKIEKDGMSVRKIIEASNVEVICTTDDPIDELMWHEKIMEDEKISYKVLPAWRPDKAVNIENTEFLSYIKKLEESSDIKIQNIDSLEKALKSRMKYFAVRGCKVSDHGLEYVPYKEAKVEEVDEIFNKAMMGNQITDEEVEKYKTHLMNFFAREYSELGWIMQLHYGCERNINYEGYKSLGPDTGYDCILGYVSSKKLSAFLNKASMNGSLPKTIIYSLNPTDNAIIDTIIGGFMEGGVAGKIQHGSAWWFNDHKQGMEEQMISLASRGVLGQFIGMLTDSRSFLSYTRHDYFRRILCNLIGQWVESGEYPEDEELLEKIIKGICHDNAAEYFGF